MYNPNGPYYTVIQSFLEAASLAARVAELPWCNLDIETSNVLDPMLGYIRLVQFGIPEGNKIHPYIVDLKHVPIAALHAAFKGKTKFIIHNAAFEVKWFKSYGIELPDVFCTMLAAQICEAGWIHLKGKFGLRDVARRSIGIDLDKSQQKSDWTGDLTDTQIEYAAIDVLYLHHIANLYMEKARRDGLLDVIELEMRDVYTTAHMELGGLAADLDFHQKHYVRVVTEMEKAEREVLDIMGPRTITVQEKVRYTQEERDIMFENACREYEAAREKQLAINGFFPFDPPTRRQVPLYYTINVQKVVPWNIGSPVQLRSWFTANGIPIPKVKKKNPKTGLHIEVETLDEDALFYIKHPIADKLIHWRKVSTLYKTFVKPLRSRLHVVDGKMHTSLNQLVDSGRRSSRDPNLQNLPVRGLDLAKEFRRTIVPDRGKLFIIADYSQIELYLIAMMSMDPVYCDQILRGVDLHADLARELGGVIGIEKKDPRRKAWEDGANFPGITPFAIYKEQRNTYKTANFASWYGAWAKALNDQSGKVFGVERWEQILKHMHATHPRIVDYFKETTRFGFENQYVTTILGRRRYFYRPDPDNKGLVSHVSRQINNTKIQGSGADMLKAAEWEIYKSGIDLRMVVHDETISVVDPEEAEYKRQVVHDCMIKGAEWVLARAKEPFDERIKIKAETVIAHSWAEKG